MKAYKGKFTKKNGSEREMVFAKIHDIVAVNNDFIAAKIIGDKGPRNYSDGQELVWDLEVDDFRIFNWQKSFDVKEIEVDNSLFE